MYIEANKIWVELPGRRHVISDQSRMRTNNLLVINSVTLTFALPERRDMHDDGHWEIQDANQRPFSY
jgi:hypothetical protein